VTNKQVKIWGGWGWKTTCTLTIDDQGFGVIDENARRAFMKGQCHALAIALHRLAGGTIKGVDFPYANAPLSPSHCVVYIPKLKAYVDIKGVSKRAPKLNHQKTKVCNRHITERTAREELVGYIKPNISAALPFARTIIRDLGL
jgi:hypothetical protein